VRPGRPGVSNRRIDPRPRSERRQWIGIGVGVAALVGATALFVAVLVISFNVLRNGGGSSPIQASKLKPVEFTGPERTVFNWRSDACTPQDIPDLPARAFTDANGRVQLISSHYVNRRFVGSDLLHLEHPCEVLMTSARNADPARYADREWLAGTWTDDGRTIYAIVHNEYQGYQHPGRCSSAEYFKCWYNAVTTAVSRDGGRTYRHLRAPPAHRAASLPYVYRADEGPYGYFAPSNIVLNRKDGYHYALTRTERHGRQAYGTCVIRTDNLADPGSWRAWGGSGYDVRFADPYTERNLNTRDHVCRPVSPNQIGAMVESLTFNEYFDKWLLIGVSQDTVRGRRIAGFFYSLSDDLISWSRRKLVREVELPWSYECGERNPVGYPSLLDPESTSRNFDTSGRTGYLFFTRYHYKDCVQNLNRDMVRVPIRFSK
jgi:hypothetical protein